MHTCGWIRTGWMVGFILVFLGASSSLGWSQTTGIADEEPTEISQEDSEEPQEAQGISVEAGESTPVDNTSLARTEESVQEAQEEQGEALVPAEFLDTEEEYIWEPFDPSTMALQGLAYLGSSALTALVLGGGCALLLRTSSETGGDRFGTCGLLGGFGALIGVSLVGPTAVYYVGKAKDGNGAWWGALLGFFGGGLVTGSLFSVLPERSSEFLGVVIAATVVLWTTGSVVGYHFTASPVRAKEGEKEEGALVRPPVPLRDAALSARRDSPSWMQDRSVTTPIAPLLFVWF